MPASADLTACVEVWRIDADAEADAPGAWAGPAERRRAGALRDPEEARRRLRTYAAVTAILAGCLGATPQELRIDRSCAWCGDASHGKPTLAPPFGERLDFNLTRSGAFALLAVSRACRVGVDVERAARAIEWKGVAALAFAARELRALAPAGDVDAAAALRCWVRKEAVAKAVGAGLAIDLRELDTAGPARLDGWTPTPLPAPWTSAGETVLVADLDVAPPVFAALAVTAPEPPPVRLRTWRWEAAAEASPQARAAA